MPFWGDRYAPEPSKALIPRPSENVLCRFLDPEAVMRMLILAVIDYLNQIEEKYGFPNLPIFAGLAGVVTAQRAASSGEAGRRE